MIRDLGRRPCLEVLREIFEELPEDDQERVQSGLHIGRVINEYQESFRRGDFLVRNVMGADESGGIAITDFVKVGQTVQFHVRDAETADEDLRTMIDSERIDRPQANVAGALIFSCNGRGSRLFDEPDHDVGVLQQKFGPIPVAGFFAMGEIGPVGGQNFVHGYTASVVLFEEPTTIPDDRA
jgi:small ligand-binding sensory domain FIST